MKYKVGDLVRIVGNSVSHRFPVDSIVRLTKADASFMAVGDDGIENFVGINDIKPLFADDVIVGIRHDNSTKDYFFKVPDGYNEELNLGDTVLLDSERNHHYGTVSILPFSGQGAIQMAEKFGATKPLRPIVKKVNRVAVADIKIPPWMSIPRTSKITERINEIKNGGDFKTRIAVNKRNELVDGYTAYLVAKMFDIKYLIVEFDNGKETEPF